ncbi:MAG: SGNH/GDSL hydrolase family protein [Prochloraceae cyanobacterium]
MTSTRKLIADNLNLNTNLNSSSSLTTTNFSKMYVFGDSLSDPGNLFQATKFVQPFERFFGLDIPIVPESRLFFEGRFSNGPVWVENLAANLGLSVTPSSELSVLNPLIPISSPVTIGLNGLEVSPYFNGATTTQGVNFAFGSAQTGQNGSGELRDFIPGVLQQVEWFINDHQQTGVSADPNALYVIWAGANDYLGLPNPDPLNTVNNISTAIGSLFDLGARNFLVPNLPDLGQTPLAKTLPIDAAIQLTNLTDRHNLLLDNTLDNLSASLDGIDLIKLDTNSLFDRVILTPEEFGLSNVSQPFLDPIAGVASGDPNQYLFWDTIHPTASVHEILADFAFNALTVDRNQFVLA